MSSLGNDRSGPDGDAHAMAAVKPDALPHHKYAANDPASSGIDYSQHMLAGPAWQAESYQANAATHGVVPLPDRQPSVTQSSYMGMDAQSLYMDATGQVAPPGVKPRVQATLWEDEGSLCFHVEAKGISVARREDNHMINGTKLLNVAGMTRGRRDGILKSEKVRHVVKIGPTFLKGVWVPFERALDFANKEKITEMLYPLFVHNIGALLYHPTNQSRTDQAVSSIEQRNAKLGQKDLGQTGVLPSVLQRFPGPQPGGVSHNSSGRPVLDRSHTFPTPPTRASSIMGSQTSTNNQWNPTGIDTCLPNHNGNPRPATPANSPPRSPSLIMQSQTQPFVAEEADGRALEIEKKPDLAPFLHEALNRNLLPVQGFPTFKSELQAPISSNSKSSAPGLDRESRNHTAVYGNSKLLNLVGKQTVKSETSLARFKVENSRSLPEETGYKRVGSRCQIQSDNVDSDQRKHNSHEQGVNDTEFKEESCISSAVLSPSLVSPQSDSESDSSDGEPRLFTRQEQKRFLLERLMDYFFELFSSCGSLGLVTTIASGGADGTGRNVSFNSSSNTPGIQDSSVPNNTSGSGGKRPYDDDEEDGGDEKRPAKRSERERDAHMRSPEQCEVNEPPPRTHGFNASQKAQLKGRPKGYKRMSEPQKWRHIYMILFPETKDTEIPSPYYEFKSLRDPGHPIDPMVEYEGFLRREMPDRVRHRLELRIEDVLNPVEETLRGQIVEIVRDVQLELFQSFRSSLGQVPRHSERDEEAVAMDMDSHTERFQHTENEDFYTLEPMHRPNGEAGSDQVYPREHNWEEQIQAYRPETVLDTSFMGFDGELFDFGSLNVPVTQDSTYGTLSMTQTDDNKDDLGWDDAFPTQRQF
ncbi:apses transcription factor [Seiridium cupressi]